MGEQRVYIMRGPSGCGKSTRARALQKRVGNATIVSRDIIRQMFGVVGKAALDTEIERKVTKIEISLMRDALYRGESVIIDNTNLDNGNARRYADQAHLQGVEFEEINRYEDGMDWVYVERSDIPQESVLRQCKRAKKMKPVKPRVPLMTPVEQDESLPPVIVFDIDGTLADSTGLRSPYDYSKVSGDRVIRATSEVAFSIQAQFYVNGGSEAVPKVVFVSGRDEECRAETEQWLRDNLSFDSELYMRGHGDDRHDAVVKREILERELIPRYHVLGVVDDRLRVLDFWRASGVFTFSVNQREEDF